VPTAADIAKLNDSIAKLTAAADNYFLNGDGLLICQKHPRWSESWHLGALAGRDGLCQAAGSSSRDTASFIDRTNFVKTARRRTC
jgi:hypothetical protein